MKMEHRLMTCILYVASCHYDTMKKKWHFEKEVHDCQVGQNNPMFLYNHSLVAHGFYFSHENTSAIPGMALKEYLLKTMIHLKNFRFLERVRLWI